MFFIIKAEAEAENEAETETTATEMSKPEKPVSVEKLIGGGFQSNDIFGRNSVLKPLSFRLRSEWSREKKPILLSPS